MYLLTENNEAFNSAKTEGFKNEQSKTLDSTDGAGEKQRGVINYLTCQAESIGGTCRDLGQAGVLVSHGGVAQAFPDTRTAQAFIRLIKGGLL